MAEQQNPNPTPALQRGRQTVYRKDDGTPYTGDPVDCKELVASGAWAREPQTAAPAPAPAAPAAAAAATMTVTADAQVVKAQPPKKG